MAHVDVIILHEGNSPTLAYFQQSIAAQFKDIEVILKDGNDLSHLSIQSDDAIRHTSDLYLHTGRLKLSWTLISYQESFYFMDDDLLDQLHCNDYLKEYHQENAARPQLALGELPRIVMSFWVSTYLKNYSAFDQKSINRCLPTFCADTLPMLRIHIAFQLSSG